MDNHSSDIQVQQTRIVQLQEQVSQLIRENHDYKQQIEQLTNKLLLIINKEEHWIPEQFHSTDSASYYSLINKQVQSVNSIDEHSIFVFLVLIKTFYHYRDWTKKQFLDQLILCTGNQTINANRKAPIIQVLTDVVSSAQLDQFCEWLDQSTQTTN